MNEKLNDQDLLLVKEKGNDELKLAGMDKDGKVKITNPAANEENPDFLQLDKNGNILENFFQNFNRQMKNPTNFEFFRVPIERSEDLFEKLQNAFRHPDKPENREFIDIHRVDSADAVKQQTEAQQHHSPTKANAIDESRIDWSQFECIGITRDSLEKSGALSKLLNWQKTDLLPITLKFDNVSLRTDARIGLREAADGKLNLSIHAIRNEPELERPYFGVKFTDEDKQNLRNTGNLGRIVEAEFKPGEKTPVLVSIDRQTNELVAFRADRVKAPNIIKELTLNEQQKKELAEGKAVYLEKMISKKETPFNAYLQFNADKRSFEFRFDNDKKQEQNQKTDTNQKQKNTLKEAPKTFRKKELTNDQRSSLYEGKTVYVSGLIDGNEKKYSGYITLNKESGKLGFMFPHKYKEAVAAGKVIPDDRHKTQVAVNSETTNEASAEAKLVSTMPCKEEFFLQSEKNGKTNETTKKVDKPLEKGQTQPTEKQAEKQNEKKAEKQTVKYDHSKPKKGRKVS
jgi:hypothetical protein